MSHLVKSTKREQIPDDNPSLTWEMGKTVAHVAPVRDRGAYMMRDLESGGINKVKDGHSQIHLTRDVSVTSCPEVVD